MVKRIPLILLVAVNIASAITSGGNAVSIIAAALAAIVLAWDVIERRRRDE